MAKVSVIEKSILIELLVVYILVWLSGVFTGSAICRVESYPFEYS